MRKIVKLLISKDCSPSRLLSHKETNVQKILISYGGGMGGATKTYYCTKVEYYDDTIVVTLLSGLQKTITRSFIVEEEQVKLVTVVVDVTSHTYFNNRGARKCTRTMVTELQFGQQYEVTESSNAPKNDQIISDYTIFE